MFSIVFVTFINILSNNEVMKFLAGHVSLDVHGTVPVTSIYLTHVMWFGHFMGLHNSFESFVSRCIAPYSNGRLWVQFHQWKFQHWNWGQRCKFSLTQPIITNFNHALTSIIEEGDKNEYSDTENIWTYVWPWIYILTVLQYLTATWEFICSLDIKKTKTDLLLNLDSLCSADQKWQILTSLH